MIEHKDMMEQHINVNDLVIVPIKKKLKFAMVVKIHPKTVKVRMLGKKHTRLYYPNNVVVVPDSRSTKILLSQ